jgi:hypothetical protein
MNFTEAHPFKKQNEEPRENKLRNLGIEGFCPIPSILQFLNASIPKFLNP